MCLKNKLTNFIACDDAEMDLFNLISAPNPTKVKTGTRPRTAHEAPLLIATATRVIAMEDATGLSSSSGILSIVEKSPLDFSNEDSPFQITKSDGTENQGQETVAPEDQHVVKKRHEKGGDGTDANAPPKVLRKDHAAFRPTQSTIGERSTRLDTGSTLSAPTMQETPADVSDPDPLSSKGATVAGDPDSEKSTSFTSFTGSSSGPTTKESYGKGRHAGSKNPGKGEEIKKLDQEIHSLKSTDIELSQQVSSLQAQITSEERIKATFEEFKRYEDDKCAESLEIRQVFADVMSAGLAKGMSEGLQYGIEHRKVGRDLGMSDGVAVSVPTAAPQGLAILLTDATTHTEGSKGKVSLRLIRSKSLPPMFNSEWP
ncbi:hypothetical protein Tco_0943882 [Tanacetum coccineum]